MSRSLYKPNTWFWVIAFIALIWNSFGLLTFIGQAYITEEVKATLPQAQVELIENRPAWATTAFAIAVFAGTFGSMVLLMRKRFAYYMFLLSFIGVLVQMVNDVILNGDYASYTSVDITLTLLIPLVGIFLIWYTRNCIHKGWLTA
jgi:hypothetical protein